MLIALRWLAYFVGILLVLGVLFWTYVHPECVSRDMHQFKFEEEFWSYCGLHLKITDSLLAVFTLCLVFATVGLWVATHILWNVTVNMDRAYLTGGGDVVQRVGRQFFRVDVANYGKTVAYLTHYDIRFASSLADVQIAPSDLSKRYVYDDRIAPDMKKDIDYVEVNPAGADIIYGCFWYTDWRKKKRYFRFILKVEPLTGHINPGRTRPDVEFVDDSYRDWN